MNKEKCCIYVDARDMQAGGWRVDTQFITTMGSPYLLSCGMGKPVEPASAKLTINYSGKYIIWARTHNWLPEYTPGRLHLEIADFQSKGLCCQPIDEWVWEKAGEVELQSGEAELKVMDDTGFYGRISAVLLTTDAVFIPPTDFEEIRKLKQEITGQITDPISGGAFEIIVAGAGVAGCLAAIAAARRGVKVLLIDERNEPGGNALLGVPVNGATFHENIRETGLVEELARICADGKLRNTQALRKMIEQEPNLTYKPGMVLLGALMQDDQIIKAVKTEEVSTGRQFIFEAQMFIDCTGDAWLGHYAGANMRRGREARSEFNEEFAPEKADGNLMSGVTFGEAFLYHAVKTDAPVQYAPPEWAYLFKSEEDYHRPVGNLSDYEFTRGTWFHEHHGDIDEFTHPEKGRDELLRIIYGVWDYVKNVWWQKHRAEEYALKTVAVTLAKRESNRIMGDYIMTQNDQEGAVNFEDRIAYGGWAIDVHNHEGIFSKDSPYECSRCINIYSIPYRCCYSKNISNLFCAGRNISVTHIALGSVRVQGTLATIGEAIGTAAAMCIEKDMKPREFGQKHIGELQKTLLKNDMTILNMKNNDPDDLALKAKFTASSVNQCFEFNKFNAKPISVDELVKPLAFVFPVGQYGRIDHLMLNISGYVPKTEHMLNIRIMKSETAEMKELQPVTELSQNIVFGEVFPFPGGATQYNESKLGWNRWLKIPVNYKGTGFLWVFLEDEKELYIGRMKNPGVEMKSFTDEGGILKEYPEGESVCFYAEPQIVVNDIKGNEKIAAGYAPEMVINGINRIVKDSPNMWASDMTAQLPQWLEAELDKKQPVNSIYIDFDTDLDMGAATAYVRRPARCVSDYEITGFTGNEWVKLAEVQDNFQRRCNHRFDTIELEKIRFTVTKTHGDLAARIFEVRIYNE